jgi:hypothetical protein
MRHTKKHLIKRHHTRRNKKYGGAETVFVCQDGRTSNELCIEDFGDDKGFIWQDVPPDGNCFFYALELYYKLTYPNSNDNKSYMKLRKIVVDFINIHFNEYEPYGITKKDIIALSKNGGWNNIAGDFVIPAAAPALNLKIKLYDLKKGNKELKTKKRIILYIYPEIDGDNGIERETVHLIRINDNHFGLLIPTAEAAPVPIVNKGNNMFKKLKDRLEKHRNITHKNSNKISQNKRPNMIQKLRLNLERASQPKAITSPTPVSNQFQKLRNNIKLLKETYIDNDPK